MNLEEFKQHRNKGSKELHTKIISAFSNNRAVSIHQFGSAAKGTFDELSDKDIWITFPDETLQKAIKQRDRLFSEMGKVVIKFEPTQNAPQGGMYSMILLETNYGLYHLDLYFAAKSKTKILPESQVIYGDDTFPRGNWFEDQKKSNKTDLNSSSLRIDFLICMSYIGIKYVVRQGKPFLDFLIKEYNTNRSEYFSELVEIINNYDFNTVRFILDQHYSIANDQQKEVIEKVKKYLSEIESLY